MAEEKYYYSATTGGFYPESMKEAYEKSINGLPEDVVEVETEKYHELMEGQKTGKFITADDKGSPQLTDRPKLSEDEILRQNTDEKNWLMQSATTVITPLQDAVDIGIATQEEDESLKEWKMYRVLLNRVDLSQPSPEWPDKPA